MADLHYVMEVEPLDLGADVKAVGLDLMEVESREPAKGSDAARIWAATLGALPGTEPWSLDFFAHLDRVREYCCLHSVAFEEKSSGHSLVIPAPSPEALTGLIERFVRHRQGHVLRQLPAGAFDGGAAKPLEFGLAVGVAGQAGFDPHRDGEQAGEAGQNEDGDKHDDQGDAAARNGAGTLGGPG